MFKLFLLLAFLSLSAFADSTGLYDISGLARFPIYVYTSVSDYETSLNGVVMLMYSSDFATKLQNIAGISAMMVGGVKIFQKDVAAAGKSMLFYALLLTAGLYVKSTVYFIDERMINAPALFTADTIGTQVAPPPALSTSGTIGDNSFVAVGNVPWLLGQMIFTANSISNKVTQVVTTAYGDVDAPALDYTSVGLNAPYDNLVQTISGVNLDFTGQTDDATIILKSKLQAYINQCVYGIYVRSWPVKGAAILTQKGDAIDNINYTAFGDDGSDIVNVVGLGDFACKDLYADIVANKGVIGVQLQNVSFSDGLNAQQMLSSYAAKFYFTSSTANPADTLVNTGLIKAISNASVNANIGLTSSQTNLNDLSYQMAIAQNATQSSPTWYQIANMLPYAQTYFTVVLMAIYPFIFIVAAFKLSTQGYEGGVKYLVNYFLSIFSFQFIVPLFALSQALSNDRLSTQVFNLMNQYSNDPNSLVVLNGFFNDVVAQAGTNAMFCFGAVFASLAAISGLGGLMASSAISSISGAVMNSQNAQDTAARQLGVTANSDMSGQYQSKYSREMIEGLNESNRVAATRNWYNQSSIEDKQNVGTSAATEVIAAWKAQSGVGQYINSQGGANAVSGVQSKTEIGKYEQNYAANKTEQDLLGSDYLPMKESSGKTQGAMNSTQTRAASLAFEEAIALGSGKSGEQIGKAIAEGILSGLKTQVNTGDKIDKLGGVDAVSDVHGRQGEAKFAGDYNQAKTIESSGKSQEQVAETMAEMAGKQSVGSAIGYNANKSKFGDNYAQTLANSSMQNQASSGMGGLKVFGGGQAGIEALANQSFIASEGQTAATEASIKTAGGEKGYVGVQSRQAGAQMGATMATMKTADTEYAGKGGYEGYMKDSAKVSTGTSARTMANVGVDKMIDVGSRGQVNNYAKQALQQDVDINDLKTMDSSGNLTDLGKKSMTNQLSKKGQAEIDDFKARNHPKAGLVDDTGHQTEKGKKEIMNEAMGNAGKSVKMATKLDAINSDNQGALRQGQAKGADELMATKNSLVEQGLMNEDGSVSDSAVLSQELSSVSKMEKKELVLKGADGKNKAFTVRRRATPNADGSVSYNSDVELATSKTKNEEGEDDDRNIPGRLKSAAWESAAHIGQAAASKSNQIFGTNFSVEDSASNGTHLAEDAVAGTIAAGTLEKANDWTKDKRATIADPSKIDTREFVSQGTGKLDERKTISEETFTKNANGETTGSKVVEKPNPNFMKEIKEMVPNENLGKPMQVDNPNFGKGLIEQGNDYVLDKGKSALKSVGGYAQSAFRFAADSFQPSTNPSTAPLTNATAISTTNPTAPKMTMASNTFDSLKSNVADSILETAENVKQAPMAAKIAGVGLKTAGAVGLAYQVGTGAMDAIHRVEQGDYSGAALRVGGTAATIGAGFVGGAVGATGGAAAGTVVAPGVGTVVGGFAGGMAGGVAAGLATNAGVDAMMVSHDAGLKGNAQPHTSIVDGAKNLANNAVGVVSSIFGGTEANADNLPFDKGQVQVQPKGQNAQTQPQGIDRLTSFATNALHSVESAVGFGSQSEHALNQHPQITPKEALTQTKELNMQATSPTEQWQMLSKINSNPTTPTVNPVTPTPTAQVQPTTYQQPVTPQTATAQPAGQTQHQTLTQGHEAPTGTVQPTTITPNAQTYQTPVNAPQTVAAPIATAQPTGQTQGQNENAYQYRPGSPYSEERWESVKKFYKGATPDELESKIQKEDEFWAKMPGQKEEIENWLKKTYGH